MKNNFFTNFPYTLIFVLSLVSNNKPCRADYTINEQQTAYHHSITIIVEYLDDVLDLSATTEF